jgi:hypothetical protein
MPAPSPHPAQVSMAALSASSTYPCMCCKARGAVRMQNGEPEQATCREEDEAGGGSCRPGAAAGSGAMLRPAQPHHSSEIPVRELSSWNRAHQSSQVGLQMSACVCRAHPWAAAPSAALAPPPSRRPSSGRAPASSRLPRLPAPWRRRCPRLCIPRCMRTQHAGCRRT